LILIFNDLVTPSKTPAFITAFRSLFVTILFALPIFLVKSIAGALANRIFPLMLSLKTGLGLSIGNLANSSFSLSSFLRAVTSFT
jgi:hypothetical protein